MITKLNRLTGNELIEFGRLSEAYEKQLVDDAVFELLVTDNLKHILAKLDALESRTARLAEYCKIGQEAGIDYLVDTSIQQDSMHLRVTYRIISTETSRIVLAKSFYDVPNDPVGVCDEIAKRLIRSLWKLEHNEI
jgi:TolB-like protein